MREILFRGKRVDDDEWIYGHYVHQYGADMIYLPDGVDREYGFDYYHTIPETIGQYTGLTDKNGKKIFEGDIIKFGLIPYEVKYDLENAKYMLFDKGGYKRDGFNVDTMQLKSVDGNIHDNPELLQDSK